MSKLHCKREVQEEEIICRVCFERNCIEKEIKVKRVLLLGGTPRVKSLSLPILCTSADYLVTDATSILFHLTPNVVLVEQHLEAADRQKKKIVIALFLEMIVYYSAGNVPS